MKNLSSRNLSPSPVPSVPVPVSPREVARKVRLSPPRLLNVIMGTPWAGLRAVIVTLQDRSLRLAGRAGGGAIWEGWG